MDGLFNNVSEQFTKAVEIFRSSLDVMQTNFSKELLKQIQREFDTLCEQYEDKNNAVKQYEQILIILKEIYA